MLTSPLASPPDCPSGVRALFGCLALFAVPLALTAKPIASQGSPGLEPLEEHVSAAIDPVDTANDEFIAEPQFDTLLSPLPPNVPSVGFEATRTSEFGDLVRLAEHVHFVDSVTVTLSSWALHSDYPERSPLGFTHPITLRLYHVDRHDGTPAPGELIATLTQSFLIPWRPEPDARSTSPLRPWRGADGNFYTGRAFTITFDLAALDLSLPDELIFGISFNTQHHGPAPLGVPGPYDWLHVGLATEPPTAGADLEPDAVFWHTANARDYADGGAAGADMFRRDTAWTPFRPAVRFNNSPYGALAIASARLGGMPAPDEATAAALEQAYTLSSWALERRLWSGNNHLRPAAGRLVFDLLAEAADTLDESSQRDDAVGENTRVVVDALLRVAEFLAETAVGDALLGSVDIGGVSRAQDALDTAYHHDALALPDKAIDHFGHAWREAELSLR